jgi:hypothetical protein
MGMARLKPVPFVKFPPGLQWRAVPWRENYDDSYEGFSAIDFAWVKSSK